MFEKFQKRMIQKCYEMAKKDTEKTLKLLDEVDVEQERMEKLEKQYNESRKEAELSREGKGKRFEEAKKRLEESIRRKEENIKRLERAYREEE